MTTSFWQLISSYKIVIPIIQRDYAQGRQTPKVTEIRNRFISSLKNTLVEKEATLELDFIYGYVKSYDIVDEKPILYFTPLDGQQRLTTLFLLHWYLAVKEGCLEDYSNLFSQFTYETRHSSNVFIQKLIEFNPDIDAINISSLITDQPWFFTSWHNDPTISSMLSVIDSLEKSFSETNFSFKDLITENSKIVFHLLPMEKLGLPDDLYIKMNSRGKELTEFEYFKSQFGEIIPQNYISKFKFDIDQKWSDLFWDLYKNSFELNLAKLSDNAFLRFYSYISDILLIKNNILKDDLSNKLLYDNLYTDPTNVEFLYNSLDILCESTQDFDDIFYINKDEYVKTKVRLFFDKPETNLFSKCSKVYNPNERINPFSLGEQILLYAYLIHKINKTESFPVRLRTLRNLIANSEDNVRFDYLGSLLTDTEEYIKTGIINESSKFNTRQIAEEEYKANFISSHYSLVDNLYLAEDHKLLRGSLAIFDLENNFAHYSSIFNDIFTDNVDYKLLSYALLIQKDYSQLYSWRWRIGTKNDSVWRELLTPSNNRKFFEKTQESIYLLIDLFSQNPSISLSDIVNNFKNEFVAVIDKPKNWIYYYINYDMFESNQDGFLYWEKDDEELDYFVMKKTSLGGSHWSPYLLALHNFYNTKTSLGIYGEPLIITKKNISIQIVSTNDGYSIKQNFNDKTRSYLDNLIENGTLNSEYQIKVNKFDDSNDIEDRITVGKSFVDNFFDGI